MIKDEETGNTDKGEAKVEVEVSGEIHEEEHTDPIKVFVYIVSFFCAILSCKFLYNIKFESVKLTP